MVDFQSRDSRPTGLTDDGGDDGANDETNEPSSRDDADDDGANGRESAAPGVAVATVSDLRTFEDDPAGEAIVDALESSGYEVVTREVLRATHDSVQQSVQTLVEREDVDVVVTTGGTGVSERDVAVEAVRPLVDKRLPGFGELFRRRYADTAGTDVVASRATAGVAGVTPVFCLPGDAEAAEIGARELLVEQAERVARLAGLDEAADP